MRIAGIERGRRWLGGLLCAVPLLGACGETSQNSGGGSLDRAGNGAGGGVAGGSSGSSGAGGSSGSGGAGGAGGGGAQGQSDPGCPKSWPASEGACTEGMRCFYAGSFSPCGPPDATFTCKAGRWNAQYGAQSGTVCLPEACPGVNPVTSCPPFAPTQGSSCLPCSAQATTCPYGDRTATCTAGLWQVTGTADPSAGGAAGAGGAP